MRTVPAAFSPDGSVGIFESNSIMRAVARLGETKVPLYGRDPYEASRIDSFLDASLAFARDSQIYLLALGSKAMSVEIHSRAHNAFGAYLCVAKYNSSGGGCLKEAVAVFSPAV
jgi:glutathione S-transferase